MCRVCEYLKIFDRYQVMRFYFEHTFVVELNFFNELKVTLLYTDKIVLILFKQQLLSKKKKNNPKNAPMGEI